MSVTSIELFALQRSIGIKRPPSENGYRCPWAPVTYVIKRSMPVIYVAVSPTNSPPHLVHFCQLPLTFFTALAGRLAQNEFVFHKLLMSFRLVVLYSTSKNHVWLSIVKKKYATCLSPQK